MFKIIRLKKYLLILVFLLEICFILKSQTLNQEAKSQMTSFISSYYANYLNDYYGSTYSSLGDYRDTTKWVKILYQYKNLNFALDSFSISYIDSINGYQWKGCITLTASAYRSIKWSTKFNDELSTKTWSDWQLIDKRRILLYKKRGSWQRSIVIFVNEFSNRLPNLKDIETALTRPPHS